MDMPLMAESIFANLHKNLRFLRLSHKKETVFLEEIYENFLEVVLIPVIVLE